jgi:phosphoribosylglycinamide formyltransferase-1
MRIAVLVSGNGSNLQALIDANLSGQIVGVLSNQTGAFALQRAQQANIATAVVSHRDYSTRDAFDAQVHQQLLAWQVDLVILAGFMRILSAGLVEQWQGRMLNIHPSLLPAYKGMHTHQRVLQTGDRYHGCTVHFVSAELDSGQALAQVSCRVDTHDSAASLAQKVHRLEHFIYPLVVQWLCLGLFSWQDGVVYFNQRPLVQPLQLSP